MPVRRSRRAGAAVNDASGAGDALSRTLLARPLATGFAATVGVLFAVVLAIGAASVGSALMSIVIALFLALGLDPVVRVLERRGLSRRLGITTVAVGFLLLVVLLAVFVVPATVRQFAHLVHGAPDAVASIQGTDWYRALQEELGVDLGSVIAEALREATTVAGFLAVSGGLLKAGMGVVGAVSSAVIVVVLTLYFLGSLHVMKSGTARLVPAYRRARFTDLLDQTTGSVGAVVGGGLTVAALNACAVLVLQFVIGSSVPVFLALVAFFITIIPLIGSLLFLVIGTAAALFLGVWPAVTFFVVYLLYIQAEAYVLTPRILGRAVAVPGVLVIIGAMVGAALLGLLGALVAMPVMASVLIVLRQVVIPRQDARVIAPKEAGGEGPPDATPLR